ncbi:MAG: RdgB/HAM1 family non-canonical purine NTP pyrophosphatase [Coriobacteriia bacterium]|nr:RdgB/HAM1 family non-canonical purine NTP pyrophosphatase [Coriobacteriia bacterium]
MGSEKLVAAGSITGSATEGSATVIVATGNAGKLAEIRAALGFTGWRFIAAGEACEDWSGPAEDGETFEANARIKARAAWEHFKLPALADDSGLEVDALGGRPGVFSSRYAGSDATDADNNTKLLAELSAVPEASRKARFRATVILIKGDGTEAVATGACEGMIGRVTSGDGGFGYDPLFLPEGASGRTMAELTLAEKNAISHRGAALRALAAKIKAGG